MNSINSINSIPFLEVLSKIGFHEWKDYVLLGKTIKMKEWWKVTDWWIWHIDKGRLKCFSHSSWRIEWDRFDLVKNKFSLSNEKTYEWFEKEFGIKNIIVKEKTTERDETYSSKWNSLPELNAEQNEYLEKRWIKNIWAYKNFNWDIARAIKTENWNIIGIQKRRVWESEKWDRYRFEWSSSGLFYNTIDAEKKRIYVVEGFTDTWTLEQFWVNVIGLVSATTWIGLLKAFHGKHELVYIADNDEAWDKSIELFRSNWVRFNEFSIKEFDSELKDVNDLWNSTLSYWLNSDELFRIIEDWIKKPPSTLTLWINRAKELRGNWIIYTGDGVIDSMIKGLMRGTTTLINWASWQWKTTFSQYLIKCLMRNNPWIRINYYSLETDIWRQVMQMIGFMKGFNEQYVYDHLDEFEKYTWELKGLEVYDNIATLKEIQQHIVETVPDVAFIDFCQKVMIDWIYDETGKAIYYAQDMQNFARAHKQTAIVSLSQVAMNNYNAEILDRMPKWSWALKESSDTMINIGKQWSTHYVWWVKAKNIGAKGWYKLSQTSYDFDTLEYTIFPPDGQWGEKFWL